MLIFQVKVIYANSLAKMQRSIITDSSCNYVIKYGKTIRTDLLKQENENIDSL